MKILIVDAVAPKPYSLTTLQTEGLGGSEASCVRLAEALNATVWQHLRTSSEGRYVAEFPVDGVSHVILMRYPHLMGAMAARYPKAKLYLWLHDMVDKQLAGFSEDFKKYSVTFVCVSETHKSLTQMALSSHCDLTQLPPIQVAYNIVDAFPKADVQVNKNKLVFFSSPIKGLRHTLQVFRLLRAIEPEMELFFANPGYMPSLETNNNTDVSNAGIVNLGVLQHKEVLKHMQEALCLFYPNYEFAETFGLVMAEANAVGTPVIAHSFGSAHEILKQDTRQLVNARNNKEVMEKVLHWRRDGNRPCVHLDDRFSLVNVCKQWDSILYAQERRRIQNRL